MAENRVRLVKPKSVWTTPSLMSSASDNRAPSHQLTFGPKYVVHLHVQCGTKVSRCVYTRPPRSSWP